jgi:[acyl-carrier-protein] S-malonyltransferase
MMNKFNKIALIFPGQGAQYVGMGKDFFDGFSIARETFEEADDVLGRKLSSLIFHGPNELLTETKNSQVAIFVVSVALLRVFQKNFPQIQPKVCSGLSLGEYTALHASGRIKFAETLKLVQLRGQLMNEACEMTQGTMAVVLGLNADQVQKIVDEVNMPNDLWAANFNCPGQVVISGTIRGIEKGTEAAKAAGAKRVLPLQVHGAFHSGLMQSAEEKLAEHVLNAPITHSSIDFVMNVPGDFVSEIAFIKNNLIKQVTHAVRWEQGVKAMSHANVDLFIEIGCKNTLSQFNKRMEFDHPVSTLNVENVSHLELIEKEIA